MKLLSIVLNPSTSDRTYYYNVTKNLQRLSTKYTLMDR